VHGSVVGGAPKIGWRDRIGEWNGRIIALHLLKEGWTKLKSNQTINITRIGGIRAAVTVMLNTNRATVYVVAGVYHGEIGEEVSRTRKMVYLKFLGPGTTVRVMQSSIKVVLGSETLTPVSGDASHV